MTVWLLWVNDSCENVFSKQELAAEAMVEFMQQENKYAWKAISLTRWTTKGGPYDRVQIEERKVMSDNEPATICVVCDGEGFLVNKKHTCNSCFGSGYSFKKTKVAK